MVTIEFEQELTVDELKDWLKYVQPLQRGEYPIHPFDLSVDEELVTIDLEALTDVFLEHQLYNDAKGFSPTRLEVLRVIEYNHTKEGNQFIATEEIRQKLAEKFGLERATSTINQHLRALIDDELIERVGSDTSGVYQYVGPTIRRVGQR